MLQPFRIALRSAVPSQRARMARALADANAERDARDVDALSPTWPDDALTVSAAAWASDDFDLLALDELIWHRLTRRGRCELQIVDDQTDPADLAVVAWQVATRFQRFERATNPASGTPFFSQILEAHARLYNRRRPFVSADYDHALDTWRWLLRLEPCAGLSLQLSALFHDVERLASESDRQDEQGVQDYDAFKRAHAAGGGRMAASILESLRTPPAVVTRTRGLIARHEDAAFGGEEDSLAADAALLATADALSFFALGAPAFVRSFGPELAARKVPHTFARLAGPGRALLSRLKLTPEVRQLLPANSELLAEPASPPMAEATPAVLAEPGSPPP
jgi:hypothetical protein